MQELINIIKDEVTKAFVECGYGEKYGYVTISNRPYSASGALPIPVIDRTIL